MGHKIQIRDLNSGLYGIQINDGVLIGGADTRREGVAVGF
jgi:gamma-glutamyltranspeptidase/glutathione hydrolase